MNPHPADMVIVGPGAIGSLVAAMLAKAGRAVCLLDHRAERAAQMAASGITVEEPDGTAWTAYPDVCTTPAVCTGAAYAVICVKAYDTADVCAGLQPHLTRGTCLVSLQNGLGNIERLETIQPQGVLAGTIGTGVLQTAPGRVRRTGAGTLWIAAPASHGTPAAETLVRHLIAAGADARIHPDLHAMLWSKLVINAAINPLTALFRIPNGLLPGHPEAAPLARQAVIEAVQVANATGIPLAETAMLTAFEAVCRLTAGNRSSMLRDVEKGRRTEIDAITGAIVRHADTCGISVPVNKKLLALLDPLTPAWPSD